MINKRHLLNQLNAFNYFKEISDSERKKIQKLDYLIAHREDGLGSKLMNYLNVLRLSKKLNKKIYIYWNVEKKSSSEIIHNYKSEYEIFKNLQNLKILKKDKETLEGNNKWISDFRFWYFKDENLMNVINELCTLAKSIKIRKNLSYKLKKIKDRKFEYGIHCRSLDITATEQNITENKYYRWYLRDGLNVGKWFPEKLIKKIIKREKKKFFVISSNKLFLKDIKKLKNVITNPLYHKNEKEINKVILDMYLLAKCKKIVCNPMSGFSLFSALISNNYVYFPTDFVSPEEIYFEQNKIIASQYYKLRSIRFMFIKIIKLIGELLYFNFVRNIKDLLKKKIN